MEGPSQRSDPLAVGLTWLVIIIAFWLTVTVVILTPGEDCVLGGGEWDAQLNRCFGRFPPTRVN